MRLATKSTLFALILFLGLLAGFALWTEYQLRSVARGLMENTARLLGSEIAAVISESAMAQLAQADSSARQRLDQILMDFTAHSDVVAAISVVDERGQVVASNDLDSGRQLAPPEVLFHDDKRAQFLSSDAGLGGGKYHLFVPLLREDKIVGYLRISIGGNRIAHLYDRTRYQLLFIAAVGLALVAVLGLLFEIQHSRIAGALTRTLEAALSGDVAPAHDRSEFAQALEAARKVGEELTAARAQSVDAQRRFGELMKVVDVGVVLVGPRYSLDLANDPARALFGCASAGELEHRWDTVRPLLEESASAIQADGGGLDIEIPADGRSIRLRLEFYPREGREGWLILVKSREMLDALENELRLAIQMRGFAQFYIAFTHDLKAPLNAMVLNLELLKSTLSAPAGANDEELWTRQQRYIQTLVDEVSRLDRYLRIALTHAAPPSEARNQFDLRELIEELGTLLNPQAKRQRIALTIDVPDHVVLLTGHRDRLKQALLNIAINGLESMHQGGEMAIQVAAQDGHALISVRDSGPGIPPKLLGEIYKMHFTTKDGGTGIGLYVARSVVQSHGGEIRVETELGHGTCFHVDLPLSA